MVSTLTVLLGGNETNIANLFTTLTALVFLVFSLLYTPCVAAIAAVKRELGGKWSLIVVLSQCGVAWLAALLAALIGRALGI